MTKTIDLAYLGDIRLLKVPDQTDYLKRAELLLKAAKLKRVGRIAPGYLNDKCFILPKGIESLIGAGAEIIQLNVRSSKQYLHQVVYKEHSFISATEEQVVYAIEAQLRYRSPELRQEKPKR